MKGRLLSALPDWLLASACAMFLGIVALMGFVVDPALQFAWAFNAGLCLALQAVLFAVFMARISPVVRGCVCLAVAAIVLAAGLAASSVPVFDDSEGNRFIYAMTMLLVNGATYALTRRRGRFVVYWIMGVLVAGYIQFVYRSGLTFASLGFFFCALLLYLYRCNLPEGSQGTRRASTPTPRERLTLLATGAIALIVSCVAASAVYVFVVAPLDPGRLSVKLFVMEEALETVEVNHPVRIEKVEDEQMHTESVTEEVITGNKSHPVDASSSSNALSSEFMENSVNYSGSQDTYSLDAEEESDIELVTFEWPEWTWLVILAGLVAAVLLAVTIRIVVREAHRHRIMKLPPGDQVRTIYKEMLVKMAKLGVAKPSSAAPSEFAAEAVANTAPFSVPFEGSDWRRVTDAFDAVCFAGVEPNGGQLEDCWNFYDGFADNARRKAGSLKYAFRYFWILK